MNILLFCVLLNLLCLWLYIRMRRRQRYPDCVIFGDHQSLRFTDGKWHHVAVISDGSRYSLYIDGELEG